MTHLKRLAPIEGPPATARTSLWRERFRSPRVISLLLALATLAVYWSVANHDYVDYDDSDYVSANVHVQGGLTWENVAWAFRTGHASNWHPLTWLSHMLDCQLFGNHPGAFHLVNVAFHIANTLLLFLVLRRMTGALWRSAFVAALFALHPVHVESVAWISERKDVLSTLFFLLTLWAYSRYTQLQTPARDTSQLPAEKPEIRTPPPEPSPRSKIRSQHPASRKTIGPQPAKQPFHTPSPAQPSSILHLPSSFFYLLALALFALGLMAKPMLVTLPFVLLLLDYWPLRRFQPSPSSQGPLNRFQLENQKAKIKNLPWLFLEKLPFLALALASSLITFLVQQKGGAVSTSLAFGERIANALVSYVRYIGKMFWPEHLSVLYPHPGHWPIWQVIACAALLLAISAGVVLLARRQPWLLFGWLWFLGTLVPVIGLVQVGIQSMADRYTYVPLLGLFIMLVWAISEALLPSSLADPESVQSLDRGQLAKTLPKILPLPGEEGRGEGEPFLHLSLPHLTQTQGQGAQEKGNKATFRHPGANLTPLTQALRPWRVAAAALVAGISLAACACLTARQVQYWRNSQTLFQHTVRVTPKNYLAYNNLGFYLSKKGKVDEAIENYRKSLEINPAYEDALNNLGYALAGRKQYQQAIPLYEAALRVRPNHVEVHNNLGNALSETGKLDDAIAHYSITLKQKPDHADAHNNLGIALAMKGKLDEAVTHFRDAIRFKPNYASAHSNLGNAMAVQHKFDEAIKQFEESLRLNPQDAQAHNNLANVLTEQGRVDEAILHYQKALTLNPDNPEAHFNFALALLRQRKREEAVTHLAEALRLRPDYLEARKQLNSLTGRAPE